MKLKIGDFAKVIATIHGHQFKEGDIVVIVSVQKNDKDYYCKKGYQGWYLKDEELKKVSKKDLQTLNHTLEKPNPKL